MLIQFSLRENKEGFQKVYPSLSLGVPDTIPLTLSGVCEDFKTLHHLKLHAPERPLHPFHLEEKKERRVLDLFYLFIHFKIV